MGLVSYIMTTAVGVSKEAAMAAAAAQAPTPPAYSKLRLDLRQGGVGGGYQLTLVIPAGTNSQKSAPWYSYYV